MKLATLRPGQTWSSARNLQGQGLGCIPDDVDVGDVFRFRFKGLKLDWWDWGGMEEHRDTTVMLPCFIAGVVQKPRDNDGRPELVVPSLNAVEFSIT